MLDQDSLPISETLESWQPHQSRRKAAVASRLKAMAAHELPTIRTPGLRLDLAEERLSEEERLAEFDGTSARIAQGRPTSARPDG